MLIDDFTPGGAKIEGAYENDRNREHAPVFKAIIREAFGVTDVICGHHLIFEFRETRADGFTYDVVQEIPSADCLIFDHDIAKKIWGITWPECLQRLAMEPIATRDDLLATMYNERGR